MTPEEEKEMAKRIEFILSDFDFALQMARVAGDPTEAAALVLMCMKKHARELDGIAMRGLKTRED